MSKVAILAARLYKHLSALTPVRTDAVWLFLRSQNQSPSQEGCVGRELLKCCFFQPHSSKHSPLFIYCHASLCVHVVSCMPAVLCVLSEDLWTRTPVVCADLQDYGQSLLKPGQTNCISREGGGVAG